MSPELIDPLPALGLTGGCAVAVWAFATGEVVTADGVAEDVAPHARGGEPGRRPCAPTRGPPSGIGPAKAYAAPSAATISAKSWRSSMKSSGVVLGAARPVATSWKISSSWV